jgi:hypothetical protein
VELLGLLADQGTRRWVADALEIAALILEIDDDAERASAILGAADRLREAIEVRVITDEVRHARDRLADALGAERFALHEARGRTLSPEAAIALALAGLTTRGSDR